MSRDFFKGFGAEQSFATVGTFFNFDAVGGVGFAAAIALDVALDAADAPGAAYRTGFDDGLGRPTDFRA
ncbi:MAG TPA: hypothetical protein VHD56_02760 [Tepidisphaeraceae bacterium]|nr:hypothetical protein [Tepidisphaeraceae bacterium]